LIALALGQSLVLVPIYLLTMPFVLDGRVVTRDAMLLASLIPLYLVGSYCSGALSGWLNFRAFNAVRMATPILYTAGVIALAATETLTAGTAALVFVAANGTADVLAVLLLWRQAGRGAIDRPLARAAVSYGLRAHIGRLSPQALGVDVIVVALFLSTRDLGLFVAAGAFLAAPRLVTASIGMVVFPHVSASHLAGERPRLRALGVLYALAATLPAIVLLVAAQPAIHLLFGSEYEGAVRVLQLLAVSSLALSLRAFPSEVLRGLGRPGLTSIAEVASWVMFLVSGALGAWLSGVEGVAAGASVASVMSLGFTCALAYRSGVFAMPRAGRDLEVA
jgi:O-antigen/teichoic acid export membrane protein